MQATTGSTDGATPIDEAPRGRVQLLPQELCSQIAAGEVLERPASAVKELVENSLDAGASMVHVDLIEGGRELIRITDDGSGMTREDAELALQRHATSKISTLDDLNTISTLGFRGEALASIASVSRMKVVTQPSEADVGTRIEVTAGSVDEVADTAVAPGTRIEVRDLFFNTPARLKFLKRVATEARRVQRWMQRLALVRYDVHFRLTHNERKRFDVPGHKSMKDRILALLGRDTCDAMYALPELPGVDGVVTRGFFSEPSHTVRGTGGHYVFVNGRFIRDRTINAAVAAAYRELLPRGRRPVVVLMLDVPFERVDVNVHPTKIEVRFDDTDAIFRSVYRGLRDGLAAAPWASDSDAPVNQGGEDFYAAQRAERARILGARSDDDGSSGQSHLEALYASHPRAGSASQAASRPWQQPPLGARPGADSDDSPAREAASPADGRYFSKLRYIGQYQLAYLVCSDAQGLVVVDQHAAHERITFERLKASLEHQERRTQRLLFPVQLELDALRAAALEEHMQFFTDLGFELEPFGGNAFALKAVPAMLAGASYIDVVKDALDDLSNLERTSRVDEAIDAVLSRIACHGSVRAGDDLTEDEAYGLFEQMDAIDFRANCPHGRPVYFRITLEELEKRFDRR